MSNQIKYRLLKWLLGDICKKSHCNECNLDNVHEKEDGTIVFACFESGVFEQARKVWGLEKN